MQVEERKPVNTMQNIILENRGKLTITGVLDVLSFDDEIAILETELGLLNIKGENIKVNKVSLESADVIIEGEIRSLEYSNKNYDKSKGTLISKIFK
ncbi:MAG: sporulation protein YabP [Clostridia bacterium]|nr:sporulation protein YabP [Clostridia bacterium]